MDYNKLKKETDNLKRKAITIQKQIKKQKEELSLIDNERHQLRENHERNFIRERNLAAEQYKNSFLSETEKGIHDSEDQLRDLEEKHRTVLESLTEENVKKEFTNEQDILAEIRETTSLLEGKLIACVGNDFYEILQNQMNNNEISLNQDDLVKLINYFNKCSAKVDRLSKNDPVDKLFFNLEHLLLELPLEKVEQNKQNITFIAIAAVIIFGLAAVFVFPIYTLLLGFYSIHNVRKNYTLYQIMIAQKSVKDNINKIDSLIHKQVLEELEERIAAENNQYDKKHAELLQQLEGLKDELAQKSYEASSNFVFDDSELKKSYEVALKQSEVKEADLLQKIHDEEKELNDIWNSIQENAKQLTTLVNEIQLQYLNSDTVGTDCLLDPKFILDVVNNKPVFFEHPDCSTLFLYESVGDVISFIRLINYQLRIKLNPFNFSSTIFDQTYLGQDYLVFTPDAGDKGVESNVFRIISSNAELKEKIIELEEEVLRRTRLIKKEFKNVRDYNSYMISIQSLAEQYEFLFLQDVEQNIIASPAFSKLLINGGDLGLLAHVFININEIKKLGDAGRKLVLDAGKIYFLQNGELFERAKEFVLDNIFSKDNKALI